MAFADPSRRVGAVLPGVMAVALLWVLYGIRRILGRPAAPPPSAPKPRPDYFI